MYLNNNAHILRQKYHKLFKIDDFLRKCMSTGMLLTFHIICFHFCSETKWRCLSLFNNMSWNNLLRITFHWIGSHWILSPYQIEIPEFLASAEMQGNQNPCGIILYINLNSYYWPMNSPTIAPCYYFLKIQSTSKITN